VILTRDPWTHRLDLARTTGQVLTADHDGVIVADTVAEWAHRHGQPYRLELTGPAGASWSSGTGGEEIVVDAADFCRIVCGRPGPDGGQLWGLLATRSLLSARRLRHAYSSDRRCHGPQRLRRDSGLGFLPVNVFVLHDEQPVAIDSGLSTADKTPWRICSCTDIGRGLP
jgi:hypothetical protein